MELATIHFFISVLLITIGLVVGNCFLLLAIPPVRELQNYRIARKTMGAAYIIMSVLMIPDLILLPAEKADAGMARIIILTLSSILALLFTYSLITLINIRFYFKQKLKEELLPISLFSVLCFVSHFLFPGWLALSCFGAFLFYYVYLLIRYTRLFRTTFHAYRKKKEGIASAQERERLNWVNTSFYYALTVGILALVSLTSLNTGFVLFKLFLIPFYIYHGFHLIDYGFKYHLIKPYVEEPLAIREEKEPSPPPSYADLDSLVNHWVKQKRYLEPGLTIESVAKELNTNRTYLSSYINTNKQQTFRTWINQLRIEEARFLLLNSPELSIAEIGRMSGVTDSGNFSRQFSLVAGISPLNWRKENTGR